MSVWERAWAQLSLSVPTLTCSGQTWHFVRCETCESENIRQTEQKIIYKKYKVNVISSSLDNEWHTYYRSGGPIMTLVRKEDILQNNNNNNNTYINLTCPTLQNRSESSLISGHFRQIRENRKITDGFRSVNTMRIQIDDFVCCCEISDWNLNNYLHCYLFKTFNVTRIFSLHINGKIKLKVRLVTW